MSQRLLASHSALFTKGVALKAGDWRNQDVTDVGPQDSTMLRRSGSVTSMASLQKQLNIERPSSSSFVSNSMIKSRSYSALLNAICDDKESMTSFPKQPDSSRPSLIIHPANTNEKSAWHANKFQFPTETSRQTMRSRPSMPNLSSLVEEKEEEGSFKPVSRRLSSLFNVATHETDYAFKILSPDTRNKSTSPESMSRNTKETSNYYIRSRLSVPNLSSLVEEEEEEEALSKKYHVSSTKNNTEDVIVDTFKPKVIRQIDIRDMSSSDLASLKEVDPFMFYSIPACRNTAWNGEHADPLSLQDTDQSPTDSSRYERKSRISVESWNLTSPCDIAANNVESYFIPSLGGAFFDFNVDDDEDDEDPIDDFLLMSFASEMVQASCR